MRALDRFILAQPVEKRALLVCLCSERSRLQTCAKNEGEGYPDRVALKEMVTSAYPSLTLSSKEYAFKKRRLQKTLENGRHWLTAHQRSPSALFAMPSHLSEKKRVKPLSPRPVLFVLLS